MSADPIAANLRRSYLLTGMQQSAPIPLSLARIKRVEKLQKTLLKWAIPPITSKKPQYCVFDLAHPLSELETTLKDLPDKQELTRVFAHYLYDDRIRSKPFSDTPLADALIDRPIMNPLQSFRERCHEKILPLELASNEEIRKRCERAIPYLYPRTLAPEFEGIKIRIPMPRSTAVFMRSAFKGDVLEKTQLKEQGTCSIVSKATMAGHCYIVKEPKEKYRIKEFLSNLILANPSEEIVTVEAMTEQELVLEYLEGGDLDTNLCDIPYKKFYDFCIQTAKALSAIHAAGYIYVDLKPDNIFMNKAKTAVKLGDLGLTRRASDLMVAGCCDYRAPEVFLGGVNSQASDVFAFGMLIYEHLFGEIPEDRLPRQKTQLEGNQYVIFVRGACQDQLTQFIWKKLDDSNTNLNVKDSHGTLRLVARHCLAMEPEKRPLISCVLDKLLKGR